MRRVRNGSQHLRGAHVRPAEHAHSSVGIRKSGGPLDGVISVIGLVLERVPLTLGGVAATHVLDYDDESASGAFEAEINVIVLVIGCALHENGKLAVGGGMVNVGAEDNAVAHFDGNVALVGDRVLVGGMSERDGETDGNDDGEYPRSNH
jgi:hypothetical protein